jgi:hypothetical protein
VSAVHVPSYDSDYKHAEDASGRGSRNWRTVSKGPSLAVDAWEGDEPAQFTAEEAIVEERVCAALYSVSCRVVSCRSVVLRCRAVPCRAVPCRAVPCRHTSICARGLHVTAARHSRALYTHTHVADAASMCSEYGWILGEPVVCPSVAVPR